MSEKRGRPPKYETVEELEKIIDDYFDSLKDDKGRYIDVPAISELGLHIGLSRQGICEYGNKDEFSDTIKKAKQTIESFLEKNLTVGKAPVGTIFNLKNNFDWKDRSEQLITNVEGDDEVLNSAKKRMGIIGDKDDKK